MVKQWSYKPFYLNLKCKSIKNLETGFLIRKNLFLGENQPKFDEKSAKTARERRKPVLQI